MEARRRRDKFCAEIQGGPAPAAIAARRTFGDLAGEWLAEQNARLEVGEMSPRTFEGYELALRKHVVPAFGGWRVCAIGPDDLVARIRKLRLA